MNYLSTDKLSFYWQICAVFLLAALLVAMPDLSTVAFASDTTDTTIECTINRVVEKLTGPVGKGIATVAVVFLGIGLFLGKLSWGLAIAVAIGIGGIFAADSIVNWIGASNIEVKCNNS